MASARQQAREAAYAAFNFDREQLFRAADAASDVWEPIARTLLTHYPEHHGMDADMPRLCVACYRQWPCPERDQAERALGE